MSIDKSHPLTIDRNPTIIIAILALVLGFAAYYLNSRNDSESTFLDHSPTPKEMEEKRIADSVRVADSIAMAQAQQHSQYSTKELEERELRIQSELLIA